MIKKHFTNLIFVRFTRIAESDESISRIVFIRKTSCRQSLNYICQSRKSNCAASLLLILFLLLLFIFSSSSSRQPSTSSNSINIFRKPSLSFLRLSSAILATHTHIHTKQTNLHFFLLIFFLNSQKS